MGIKNNVKGLGKQGLIGEREEGEEGEGEERRQQKGGKRV